MFSQAIKLLADELNKYLRTEFNIQQNMVIISNFVNLDGSLAVKGEDLIVITLVGLQQDAKLKNELTFRSGVVSLPNFEVCSILVSSYFSASNYLEGLTYLQHITVF